MSVCSLTKVLRTEGGAPYSLSFEFVYSDMSIVKKKDNICFYITYLKAIANQWMSHKQVISAYTPFIYFLGVSDPGQIATPTFVFHSTLHLNYPQHGGLINMSA